MPLAFGIVYTVQDEEGDSSTYTVHVPSSFALADYVSFVGQMAQLVDDVIDGIIVSANLGLNIDLTGLGLKSVITVINDIERKGFFSFITALGKRKRVNIPTFKQSLVNPGGNDIDTGDVAVSALLAGFTNGLTTPGGNMSPCNDVESDLTAVAVAEERFRTTT